MHSILMWLSLFLTFLLSLECVLILFWFSTTHNLSPNRFSVLVSIPSSLIDSGSRHYFSLFVSLISFIGIINLIGNIPGVSIMTLYYFFTSTLSGSFWLSLMILVILGRLKDFIAHMLPYGSPVGLYLFLPIVELFSQLIRPLTLMIRLSTNLAAGHIMMYMFSFFSVASLTLTFSCSLVLGLLFGLELMISLLQAYIFSTLLYLYISETL